MAQSFLAAGMLGMFAIGLSFVGTPEDKVVFLDVGQGDAILIQQGNQQVLIDGGEGNAVLQRLTEEMPAMDRRIEVIISSHPDRDHLEGLLHVIERYEVELVILPQMPHTSQLQDAWLTKLYDGLQEKDISYRFAWEGQFIDISNNLRLHMIGPFAEDGQIYAPGKKTNNAAVLTRVDYHGLSFLLTSDAEAAVERKLVAEVRDVLDVDVLKAGHHGSKTSTTEGLLAAASPSVVVVSVGKENRYGHPAPTVMDRLAPYKVFRTDQDGSVEFLYHTGRSQWMIP